MNYLSEKQKKKENENKLATRTDVLRTNKQTNTVRRISNKCKNRFFLYRQNKNNNYYNYPSKPNTSKSGFSSTLDLNEPRVILHFLLFDKFS